MTLRDTGLTDARGKNAGLQQRPKEAAALQAARQEPKASYIGFGSRSRVQLVVIEVSVSGMGPAHP